MCVDYKIIPQQNLHEHDILLLGTLDPGIILIGESLCASSNDDGSKFFTNVEKVHPFQFFHSRTR